VQIDRGRMLKPPDLLANARDDFGMTMSDRNGDNPGECVEVLLAGLVPEVLHVAFDDQERLLIIREQARAQVLTAQRENLVAGGPLIGGRRVRRGRRRKRRLAARCLGRALHVCLLFEASAETRSRWKGQCARSRAAASVLRLDKRAIALRPAVAEELPGVA